MSKPEKLFSKSRHLLIKGLLSCSKVVIVGRKPEFRMSSMPYCPLIYLLGQGVRASHEGDSQYYFDVGTSVHTWAQKVLPMTKVLRTVFWGNWECRRCGNFETHCTQPETCAECGASSSFDYEEIEITYRGLSGHVDTVLQIDYEDENGDVKSVYVVVDYKTTTFFGRDRSKFPVPQNTIQIGTYCVVLNTLYGMDVIGWHLVYVDRKGPVRSSSDFHLVSKFLRTRDIASLKKRVDAWCDNYARVREYNAAGTPEEAEAFLHDIVKNRPCRTTKDFESKMAPAFYYEEGSCPQLNVCTTCKDEDVAKHVRKLNDSISIGHASPIRLKGWSRQ